MGKWNFNWEIRILTEKRDFWKCKKFLIWKEKSVYTSILDLFPTLIGLLLKFLILKNIMGSSYSWAPGQSLAPPHVPEPALDGAPTVYATSDAKIILLTWWVGILFSCPQHDSQPCIGNTFNICKNSLAIN